MYSFSVLRTR